MKNEFKVLRWIGVLGVLFFYCGCDKDNKEPKDGHLVLELTCNELMGEVTLEPEQDYYGQGQEVKLIATAKEGFAFTAWRSGGTELSSSAALELVLESDTALTALFEAEEDPDWLDAEEFQVEVKCGSGGKRVEIDPAVGPYMAGSVITLEAVAKAGYRFSGWEGLLAKGNPVQLIVEDNLDVVALFEKVNPSEVVDLQMTLKGVYNYSSGFWDFEVKGASLLDDNDIEDAVVSVCGLKIEKSNRFIIQDLELSPGEEIEIVVQHESIGEKSYSLLVPPLFNEEDNLTFTYKDELLTLDWEDLDCDGYRLIRQVNSGKSFVSADFYSFLTESVIAVTKNEICTYGYAFETSDPMTYTLWICPVNRLESLEGLAEGSGITLVGRRGTTVKLK